MPVRTGADAAIHSLAAILAQKRAKGDVDLIMRDAGFANATGDKFTRLYSAMSHLIGRGQVADLELLIDRLTAVHTLSQKDIDRVRALKSGMGLGRNVPLDLGPYGSLRLDIETRRMIQAYATLRMIETELRFFLERKLKAAYGKKWIVHHTSSEVKESIRRARQKEIDSFYQSIKPDSDIFYTDFKDLKSIISTNWKVFDSDLLDQTMVFKKLEELELGRNIIAHNRILTEIELERLEVYAHDLLKSVGVVKD